MKIEKGRDAKKAIADSLKNGNLVLSGPSDPRPTICDTCKKEMDDVLDAYSYHVINDDDTISVNEKCFCTRKCWESYLKEEVEKINSQ